MTKTNCIAIKLSESYYFGPNIVFVINFVSRKLCPKLQNWHFSNFHPGISRKLLRGNQDCCDIRINTIYYIFGFSTLQLTEICNDHSRTLSLNFVGTTLRKSKLKKSF